MTHTTQSSGSQFFSTEFSIAESPASGSSASQFSAATSPATQSPPALQLEVTIQDLFLETFLDRPVDPDQKVGNSLQGLPIRDETWEDWLRCWLEQLYADLPPSQSYELTLRLTDDTEMQMLNAQYRHKNQPTDVLAFAALEVDYPHLGDMSADLPLYLGDIVISVETAARQAQQQGHSLKQELAWLTAHALLHLLGWDHPDDASLEIMLQHQEILLQQIDLSIGS